ncbi:MAG: glycosyltransferase [Candidatus Omnitrophica bacterium]|nr:glycosyltransferase [Candidatus Omnitrophota bacterium]
MRALYISYDGATEPIAGSQIIPYLEKLAARGVKFFLVTFDKKEYLADDGQVVNTKDIFRAKGIDWFSLRYHKRPTALATAWDIFHGFIVSFYIVLKEKIYIVHARSYVSALIALGLKFILRRKFVFDMRGYWADERIDGQIWPEGSALYKIAKYMEKVFVNNADFIVVLTESMKNRLRQDYRLDHKPIEVIPTCVDLRQFQILRPEDKDDFLNREIKDKIHAKDLLIYLGSLGTVYMLEEMFELYKILRSHISNLHFLLLTQSDREIAHDAALKRGIADNGFTVASVRHADVSRWLNLGKLAIAFYRPTFSVIGRAPTKIGEYLACGLPAIVNKGVGDIDTILAEQKVGIVLESFDQQGYKQALPGILDLLGSKDLRQRCHKVAQDYFSLEKGVNGYFKIYQTLKN